MSKTEKLVESFREFIESMTDDDFHEYIETRYPSTEITNAISSIFGHCIAQLVEQGIDPLTIGVMAYHCAATMQTMVQKLKDASSGSS